MKRKSLILLVALLVLLPSFAQKVTKEWVEKNYVKKEQMITMRDGVKLFTAIYEPRSKAVKHPIIMTRTPYSCNPYGKEFDRDLWSGMSLFANAQYIIVFQDVRGKFMAKQDTLLSLANVHAVNETGQSSVDIDRVNHQVVNVEAVNFRLPGRER